MAYGKPLSDLYQLYSNGSLPKKEFEGKIFHYLMGNCERHRFFNGNKDTWNDFLSWLYVRIVRAIDQYREQGASFDAYIAGIVHTAAREYRCREADHSITESACWQARAADFALHENEPEYNDKKSAASIPAGISRRQILLLLLKSYFFVSEELVERVVKSTGFDPGSLKRMMDELRERRSKRECEIRELRERLHCQHYRYLAYQKRMLALQPGTSNYETMKDRFERAKKRYAAMKNRLGGMRMSASNKMIAEVTGIPRGTVDSALYAVKRRLQKRNFDTQGRKEE